ncbi:MAG: histidinol-phosphate transaminase [Pseudomonadota bacterium]
MACDYIALASPGIQGLQPYQPGKPEEELERELGLSDIVKLASNENPMGPSPSVVEGLPAAIAGLARYPDGSGFRLKKKLASFLGVNEDQLTLGNGSNDVLELIARVYLNTGNEAIVSEHCFVVYPLAARSIGAGLTVVPATDYGQDLPATLAAITDKTRMIFIANPNNPTGTWLDQSMVTGFLDEVPDNIIVVLDEAYFEYMRHPDYPDGIALLDRYPNLVVTRTFSKAYGLAGLRIGYAVSQPAIADLMNRVRQPFNVNSLSLLAAEIALDDQAHVEKAVAMNTDGLDVLMNACKERGLGYIPSAGNFLTIDMGRDAAPIYDAFLHQGVIVRPIGVYGLPNHLRVTVGLPSENERFVKAMSAVLSP